MKLQKLLGLSRSKKPKDKEKVETYKKAVEALKGTVNLNTAQLLDMLRRECGGTWVYECVIDENCLGGLVSGIDDLQIILNCDGLKSFGIEVLVNSGENSKIAQEIFQNLNWFDLYLCGDDDAIHEYLKTNYGFSGGVLSHLDGLIPDSIRNMEVNPSALASGQFGE